MTFPSIHPALDRALAARNYATPTAVQLAVLQDAALKRDLLVSAQTGSGKTVAFGLAMAATLLTDAERFEPATEPSALIIAPTRELALQVQRELDWLYAETGARIMTCVGGMDPRAEARQLDLGAHVVVGTPGRLRDHIERRRLDLSKLRTIVLDEADEMLDLGFREDLEFILEKTPAERQTLLFSATMPRDIEVLAARFQRDAHRIETIRRDEQHADIEYRAHRISPNEAENAVVNVLRFHEPRAALVFCTTREAVKRMHGRLVERGFAAVALSGELTQAERSQALVAVRDGRARVLVATDVAARGLDLPDLALVIHGELPHDRETLLHRSGRTGRAGKKGLCVLIVPHHRRRKAEALLGAARLRVNWAPAPTADEIRHKDQQRFHADPIFTDTATEAEAALVASLQGHRSADEIALALVRLNRARLPEPEELTEDAGPPPRRDRARDRDRSQRVPPHASDAAKPRDRSDRHDRAAADFGQDRAAGFPRPRRDDGREKVWFRLNIGRNRNADPRWLLPLICKAGGISKAEIGAIKIFDQDTRFEIAAEHADRFADTVRTSKHKEGHITRVGNNGSSEDVATVTASQSATAATPDAAAPVSPAETERAPRRDERPRKPWKNRDKPGSGSRPAKRSFADKKRPRDDQGPRHLSGRTGPSADRRTPSRERPSTQAVPDRRPR